MSGGKNMENRLYLCQGKEYGESTVLVSGGRTEGIGCTCVRGKNMENRLYLCQGKD